MTYSGPERRDNTDIATALNALTGQVNKLGRLIEGETGSLNRGVLGALTDLTFTDSRLDKNISDLTVRVSTVERRWSNLKWGLVGYAAGGGLLGGSLAAVLLKLAGA